MSILSALHPAYPRQSHSNSAQPIVNAPRCARLWTETSLDGGATVVPLQVLVGALFLLGSTIAAEAVIYDAVLVGNADAVRRLARSGADVNERGDLGTPLHVAAAYGEAEMAALLIDLGAQIEAEDVKGFRPLHQAASNNHPGVVALLLRRGADPDPHDIEGRTPLLMAVRTGYAAVARRLLEAGADPNVGGHHAFTPLHWAVKLDRPDLIRLLLAHGANIVAGASGVMPLHLAARHASPATVELLVTAGTDVSTRTQLGETALAIAEAGRRTEVAAVLRRLGARE
nr:ankyrin repeat domain-containing protein [Microvirga tunisiensis]